MSLYIIPTPIGNLGDIGSRALGVLQSISLALCEDTRRTRSLYSALGLPSPKLLSFHAHNERQKEDHVIRLLQTGQDIGLLSDAGTPAISDPGALLVARCHRENIQVICIPGPCAVPSAISVSGFHGTPFHFLGFLPRKSGQRRALLKKASQWDGPIVIYESGQRFPELLSDLLALMPERELCLCRELTKMHEEITRGPLTSFDMEKKKGELALVLGPGDPIFDEVKALSTLKDIAGALANEWGIRKREAYNLLQSIKPPK